MKYDKWVLKKGETIQLDVFAVSDRLPMDTVVKVIIMNGATEKEYSYKQVIGDGIASKLGEISVCVKDSLTVTLFAEHEEDMYENTIDFVVK